jgi:uncharacterized protein (TIGR02099 family)
MSPVLHRRLHLARRGLGYALAVVVVVAALVGAIASQLLPLAEHHPDRIAAWLGERVGRPVAFDRVETQWTRRGPLLRLDGLRLGEGDDTIRIGDAEMLISQYAGLLPGRSFTELRLRGLDLTLQRGDDGRWRIRGLPGEADAGGDPFASLEGLGELQVIGGKLAVVAPGLHLDARLPRVDMRLRVDGDRVRIGMRAWMRAGRAPVLAVADFDRVRGNGRGYLAAKPASLSAWSPLLHVAGIGVDSGVGHGEAWATLRDHRIASLLFDADFSGVVLEGAAPVGGKPARVRLAHLQALAQWQAVPGGWRVDAKHLRIGDATARTRDGVVLAGGARQALLAHRLDLRPLLAVAALSDRLDPGLRRWLQQAHPRGIARDVSVAARGGRLRASGRLDAAGFDPVGAAPGFQGLAGNLDGDAGGIRFDFDASAPFRFDWPRGFGEPHPARLQGTVAGWREGSGWRVGTRDLRVRGDDFGADVRGGLWFQGDGTRPWIDLAASIETTAVTAAKGFWIHDRMPPAAVHWLDEALQGGRIEGARALVSGDLDHWPFRGSEGDPARGLFQVRAHVADATLRFQPDWPAAEHVDADVEFVADGFQLSGKGVLAGVGIRHFTAGIEHFGKARLLVAAQGGGDASRLLGLLRRSPLHETYGETLDNLTARGLASVDFGLDLPLHAQQGRAKVSGNVVLAGAQLAEKRWKLVFDDVRGRAAYGSGGFVADRLAVRHEGSPGRLSLRAGNYARSPRNAFEAQLDATLPATALLQRVPELAWMRPYVDGRSSWSAQLAIPVAGARKTAPPGRLQLDSNLAGTRLAFPAPLRKARDATLATTIETALPLEAGEIRVALGKRLGVRARSDAQTGVRVMLGSDTVAEAPPASGLAVGGHADVLDAVDWIALAKAATAPAPGARPGTRAAALPLRQVDVRVDRLDLLGASFPAARVRLAPAPGGLAAQVQGEGLEGNVRVPDAAGATVSGRFARVHWRPAPADAATAGGAAADDGAAAAIDPAQVPPLSFDIADLRVGDASLGKASLRTQPVAAGMRITRLQADAPAQHVAIHGDWLGRGASTRTQLEATVDSRDFGALLAGFGYGGQLSDGDGHAKLSASWPGGPSKFSLLALDGTLALDVRDGQLTELEPGAGRVLGLLSIAQLPRRLTLDFRDLFSKGFAFDKLAGTMRIAGARASSDDLVIAGPAAEIRIRGSADLRAQAFDQTIEVRPRAGNLLTVAGAIAGGPVGAAIGAAANAMLRKPLGELAAKTYRVTGAWKDPHVEVVGRGPPGTATAETTPPG